MNKMTKRRSKEFLNKEYCPRCGGELTGRIMSFFKDQVICLKCSEKEDKIKEKLNNPTDYEGIGHIPEVV